MPSLELLERRLRWHEVTDTAFFGNEACHTKDDIPDRLDYKAMAEVLLAVGKTVLSEGKP